MGWGRACHAGLATLPASRPALPRRCTATGSIASTDMPQWVAASAYALGEGFHAPACSTLSSRSNSWATSAAWNIFCDSDVEPLVRVTMRMHRILNVAVEAVDRCEYAAADVCESRVFTNGGEGEAVA